METFLLPANDERFLRLTTNEALEQVMLVAAVKEWRADLIKKRKSPYYDDIDEVDAEITTGEDGAAVADEANLLGDEENDEIELAETSDGGVNWQEEYEAYLREKKSA